MIHILMPILAGLALFIGAPPASADQNDPRLDGLFDTLLSDTLDPSESGPVQNAIWRIWTETGDVRGDTLMRDGIRAMHDQDFTGAIAIFTALIEHMPDLAEAWNKRATVYYLVNRFDESIADVERTLALEPRHFGAMSGLGLIYVQQDRTEAAIKAFEQTLKMNPYLPTVEYHLLRLYKQLEDERI